MRTTLSIDDDLHAAIRGLAQHERKTMGAVLTALARKALRRRAALPPQRNGVPRPKARPQVA